MEATVVKGVGAYASEKRKGLLAIVVGGLAAGILDLAQACILFGPKIPLAIAGGLLRRGHLVVEKPATSWVFSRTS